jgi:hypothetical protein
MAKLNAREQQMAERTLEELVDEHMRDLRERVEELEATIARVQRTNGASANGTRAKRSIAKDKLTGGNGQPRWLPHARFASKCQANCGDPVHQGERVWYEPGVGVWHESCAPATAVAA